jgi:type I restriction-modification system DNA methylase subunit
MTANVVSVQNAVKKNLVSEDLETLFIQVLLWHKPKGNISLNIDGGTCRKIATLKGLDIWWIQSTSAIDISKVEKEIAKQSTERLVIQQGINGNLWRWPESRRGGVTRISTHEQSSNSAPLWLVQRLSYLRFEIEEQSDLTIIDVRERMSQSFASDQITNKFFGEFRKMHLRLSGDDDNIGELKGIDNHNDRRWYSSVLLNRLMFLYFLEKKGFLDNDTNYLRTRLTKVQKTIGYNEFFSFYSKFLIPLFHNALGSNSHELHPDLREIIGDVPYLNGGVFARHPLEELYSIVVPDKIFEEIFDIFDSYKWHLDDSPGVEGNEINPDVLGHIFEKYVNQTETGAFYTPMDVTSWMSSRTIASWLLDRLEKLGVNCSSFLKANPERYFYSEVFLGQDALKDELKLKFDEKRKSFLDLKCDNGISLPGENYWEALSRLRNGQKNLDEIVASSQSLSVFEMTTRNLDLVSLAEEIISELDKDDLEQLWESVKKIRVIDPTCGSGAFLIATMDSLESYLEILLSRFRDIQRIGLVLSKEVEDILLMNSRERVAFLRRGMIMNNIFGADIAEEAVEIARLRMYLSLVSLADTRAELIPLPDLEFNLAVGNLIVGINDLTDLEDSVGTTLASYKQVDTLKSQIKAIGEMITRFQHHTLIGDVTVKMKNEATSLIDEVTHNLDRSLWSSLTGESLDFEDWKLAAAPLHYVARFPEAMLNGGFDLVIGNPPFISASKVFTDYRPGPMICNSMPDIFAHCTERASSLLNSKGKMAFVLPYFFSWNADYAPLRKLLTNSGGLIVSSFGSRPDALFRGVEVRISILNLDKAAEKGNVFTSEFQHWIPIYRPALFKNLRFEQLGLHVSENFLRLGNELAKEIFVPGRNVKTVIGEFIVSTPTKYHIYVKKTGGYYLAPSILKPKTLDVNGAELESNLNVLYFSSERLQMAAFAIMCSRLAYLGWKVRADDYNVTKWFLESLPFSDSREVQDSLTAVGRDIADRFTNDPLLSVWNPRSGKWMQTFDTRGTYDVSDQAVSLILGELSLSHLMSEFEAWYWRHMKSTGDAPGTKKGKSPFS